MKKKSIARKWNEAYCVDELFALGGKDLVREAPRVEDIYHIRRRLLDVLNVQKDGFLLDIGCGSLGSLVVPAAELGLKVFGLDISPVAIKLLERRLLERGLSAKVLCGDILEGLPFPDNYFDYVFSIYTVQHILEIDKFLAEATRVTKSGGMLYINSFMNKYHPLNIERRILRKCYEIILHRLWWTPMGTISRGELTHLYKKLGLDIIEFGVYNKEAYIPLKGLVPCLLPQSVIKSLDQHLGIEEAYAIIAIKR